MVEVIKRGKAIQTQCRKCNSILQFDPAEAHYTPPINGNGHYFFFCPVCDQIVCSIKGRTT